MHDAYTKFEFGITCCNIRASIQQNLEKFEFRRQKRSHVDKKITYI